MNDERQGAEVESRIPMFGTVKRQSIAIEKEWELYESTHGHLTPTKAFRRFMFKKIAQIHIELLRKGATK